MHIRQPVNETKVPHFTQSMSEQYLIHLTLSPQETSTVQPSAYNHIQRLKWLSLVRIHICLYSTALKVVPRVFGLIFHTLFSHLFQFSTVPLHLTIDTSLFIKQHIGHSPIRIYRYWCAVFMIVKDRFRLNCFV